MFTNSYRRLFTYGAWGTLYLPLPANTSARLTWKMLLRDVYMIKYNFYSSNNCHKFITKYRTCKFQQARIVLFKNIPNRCV